MRRCRSWYRIRELLHNRLPLPPGPLADSLALWLQGMLLAENVAWTGWRRPWPPAGATSTRCAGGCATG